MRNALALPPVRDPALYVLIMGALLFALTLLSPGCANLSAEQNRSDADHAQHVLLHDTADDAPPAVIGTRDNIITELQATAGTATPQAAQTMDNAAEWWRDNHRPLNEHVITARERFWREASKTAHEAAR